MAYTTATGQRAVVALPDGSRVTLAPRTTLRFDPSFGTGSRAVAIDGEAYFEVPSAAGTPFVVRSHGVTTRVLGTTFTVRHYASDACTHVAVVSGRVTVMPAATHERRGRPSAATVVNAGEVVIATDSSATTASSSPTAGGTKPYTTWVSGQLVFYESPTSEVLAALTRWYGYEFRLADPKLAMQTLTVGVSTESSAAALSTIKLALDVDLAFDGNVVTLSPRRAVRAHAQPKAPNGADVFGTRTHEAGR